MKLKTIVEEIEEIGKLYKTCEDKEIRNSCNDYINLIILNEAEKSEQYNLCDYWERVIR